MALTLTLGSLASMTHPTLVLTKAWCEPTPVASPSSQAAKPDAAASAELSPTTVLATLNDRPITVAEIDKELERPEMAMFFGKGNHDPAMVMQMRAAVLNSVINRDLLLAASRKSSVIDTTALQKEADQFVEAQGGKEKLTEALTAHGVTWEKFMEELTDGVRLKQYVENDLSKSLSVTDEDAKKIFDANPSRFAMPELVRARHILIKSAEENPDARKKIDDLYTKASSIGADFGKLAEEISEDTTTKPKGGDLGFFRRGMMVPEFEAAAFDLKVGEVSKPIKTSYGYHIIKVEERKAPEQPDFTQVQDKVKALALTDARNKALAAKVAELRKTAKVEYKVPGVALDLDAQGSR